MPECTVCGLRKKPYGRNAGVVAANSYCGPDCEGYRQEPLAGHFWPGEHQTCAWRIGCPMPLQWAGVMKEYKIEYHRVWVRTVEAQSRKEAKEIIEAEMSEEPDAEDYSYAVAQQQASDQHHD
jgi:hypothetical protein